MDQTDFASSEPALTAMLARPQIDLQHDVQLWFDARGLGRALLQAGLRLVVLALMLASPQLPAATLADVAVS